VGMEKTTMNKRIAEVVDQIGLGPTEELVLAALNKASTRKTRGVVTSAGLALPEAVVEWLGGPTAGVRIDDDGTIYVDREGTLKVTLREFSRQGVVQNGEVRHRLYSVGYQLKDKVIFRYNDVFEEFIGRKVIQE